MMLVQCVKKERSPNTDLILPGRYCVLVEEDPTLIYGSNGSYNNFFAMWPKNYNETSDFAIDYDGERAMFSLNNSYAWKFHPNTKLAFGTTAVDGKRGIIKFERLSTLDNNHVIKNYLGECLRLNPDKFSVFTKCDERSTRYILIPDCTSKDLLVSTVDCLMSDDKSMQCLAPNGPRPIATFSGSNFNPLNLWNRASNFKFGTGWLNRS